MEQAVRGNAAQELATRRWVYYSGTDQLLAGYLVCYDHDNATVAERRNTVEKPSLANITAGAFAGVVVTPPRSDTIGAYGPGWCQIAVPSQPGIGNFSIYTDDSCTIGDLLGPAPATYYARKSVIVPPIAIVTETTDRSSTAGLVNTDYKAGMTWDQDTSRLKRMFCDFDGQFPIGVNGLTPAEITNAGWNIRGASDTGAYSTGTGGNSEIVVTAGGASTLAQLEQGGAPFLLSTGRALFWRARVKRDAVTDEEMFVGLASIGGASIAAAGSVGARDDYMGFVSIGASFAVIRNAYNADNGTDRLATTGVSAAADTYNELAQYIRNRNSGTTASSGAKTLLAYVDGTLTNTIDPSDLFNNDVSMGFVAAAISGTAVMTVDRVEVVIHL